MWHRRLYLCGFLLLLTSTVISAQDDTTDGAVAGEDAVEEAVATEEAVSDAAAAAPEAEPTASPIAEPTELPAATEETEGAASSEPLTEPPSVLVVTTTKTDTIESDIHTAAATTPQTTTLCRGDLCEEVAPSTTAGSVEEATSAPAADETTAVPAAAETTVADTEQQTTVLEDASTEQPDEGDASTTETAETTGAPASTAAAAPPVSTPVEDPCTMYEAVSGIHYSVEKPEGDVQCFDLFDSPSAWIRFHLKDESDIAEIPTVPIKQDYCGVHFAFHVHLQDKQMPGTNQSEMAEICSYLKGEVDQPCANNKPVRIYNCNDEFFVYKFPDALRDSKLCDNKGGADVCLQRPGEVIPDKYRSDIIPTTTSAPTEPPVDYDLPRLEDLTEEQANGTITIEYNMPEEADPSNCTGFWIGIDEAFRQMIADALNAYLSKPSEPEVSPTTEAEDQTTQRYTTAEDGTTKVPTTTVSTTTTTTPAPTEPEEFFELSYEFKTENTEPTFDDPHPGPQASDNIDDDAGKGPTKREAPNEPEAPDQHEDTIKYTKDDVYYVHDTPTCVKGIIQVSIVVLKTETESKRQKRSAPSGNVVPQGELDKAISGIDKNAHQDNTGLEYVQHYQGEPRDPEPKSGAVGAGQMSLWDAHMGLFIALIVLVIICLIVIIIGILCIKCKGEKSKPEKTPLRAEEGKSSTVIENPISDDEMIKGEAPMTEAPNPAYTPNGSGQHLTRGDEDNGWIVPLEELSYAERERPEVENTKL